MRMKRLRGISCVVLYQGVVIGSCSPDRVSFSTSVQEVSGHYLGAKADIKLPAGEVTLLKKIGPKTDIYTNLRGTYISPAFGKIGEIEAQGKMIGAGIGVHYFPVQTHLVGVDLGVEALSGEYELQRMIGPANIIVEDNLVGAGLRLGVISEVPIGKNKDWALVGGAGHRWMTVSDNDANADLTGWYGTLGIQIPLGKK